MQVWTFYLENRNQESEVRSQKDVIFILSEERIAHGVCFDLQHPHRNLNKAGMK